MGVHGGPAGRFLFVGLRRPGLTLSATFVHFRGPTGGGPAAALPERGLACHPSLLGRVGDADATYGQVVAAERNEGAVVFLDWFALTGLTLDAAGQGDLDAWLTSTESLRGESGTFVRWARKHKLTDQQVVMLRLGREPIGHPGPLDVRTQVR